MVECLDQRVHVAGGALILKTNHTSTFFRIVLGEGSPDRVLTPGDFDLSRETNPTLGIYKGVLWVIQELPVIIREGEVGVTR